MLRWRKPITNYLVRFCGDHSVALDLAEETFVRVYQARGRYEPTAKFSTWLFAIAHNLARNLHRRNERHPTVSIDSAFSDEEAFPHLFSSDGEDPAQSALSMERIAAVKSAIAGLNHDERTSILLSEYEGVSVVEIAAVLKCSHKAAEMKLYRARQHLRAALAKWLRDE